MAGTAAGHDAEGDESPRDNRSKAIGSVPGVSLGPCEEGFNTKVAKIAKITKKVNMALRAKRIR
jgi:hypothetical protein